MFTQAKLQVGSSTMASMCWCAAKEVQVPSDLVRRCETVSCDRDGCYRGCDMFDDKDDELPLEEAIAAILEEDVEPTLTLTWEQGLCWCGCAEPVKNKFRMGHDARFKKYVVSVRPVFVVINDLNGGSQTYDAITWLSQLNTDKFTWTNLVKRDKL